MNIKLSELENAFLYQDAAHDVFDAGVWLDRESGRFIYRYEEGAVDDAEPVPEDIEDNPRYVPLPTRFDLDLGRPLALAFAREFRPQEYEEIANTLRGRGGWHRFKDHLDEIGLLREWYDYQEWQTRKALRIWCEEEGFAVEDDTRK